VEFDFLYIFVQLNTNPLKQMVTLSSVVILVVVTSFVSLLFMKPEKK